MSTSEMYGRERLHRRRYCFGDFTLDLEGGFLRRGPDEVKLPPKPFQLLAYLVEHHGRLSTKSELIKAVWPDTAITDNSLAQCLLEVRRALGDESQQLIRTVARRGYVFTAPVTSPALEFPEHRASGPTQVDALREPLRSPVRRSLNRHTMAVILGLTGIAAAGMLLVRLPQPYKREFIQITNFTDSETSRIRRWLRCCRQTAAWLPSSEATTGCLVRIKFTSSPCLVVSRFRSRVIPG
jgi:DNA-binding winged helix-turn-helix (wHTH) protein